MMEGQEGQRLTAPVVIPDNAAVFPVDLEDGKRLFADGGTGIRKDPAAAGSPAGTHGHIFAPYGGETDGTGRTGHCLVVDLPDIPGQPAGFAGDDYLAAGFLQQALGHVIRGGGIQQQGVMPGTDDAPEQGGPVVAGIYRNGDPAALRRVGREIGGKVICTAGHFGEGFGKLFLFLQPDGAQGVAVVAHNVKKCGPLLVCVQAGADLLYRCVAHEDLLPFVDVGLSFFLRKGGK